MPFKNRDSYLHLVEFTLTKPLKLGRQKSEDNGLVYVELNSQEYDWLHHNLVDLQEAGKIKKFSMVLCNLRDYAGALEDIEYETSKED